MNAARYDFDSTEVVVVGASRGGIGAAIARAFQDAGATVSITGAEDVCLPEDAERFDYTQLDVTDDDAVEAFARRHESLGVLVNCAAITRRGEEMEPSFFSKVLDINLTGSLRTALAFHPALQKVGGSVVNIASMYARFASPPQSGLRSVEGGRGADDQIPCRGLGVRWSAGKCHRAGLHRDRAIRPGARV
jgi:NAD(P)-dependent dehydrogenase (short-subunit alcohol dehydrogenase family)